MRIKFIVISILSIIDNSGITKETPIFSITPIYYFLKSFYKIVGKYYDKYIWLPTEYGFNINIVDVLESIDEEKPDIVCFSMFVWNFDMQIKIAKLIKQKYPHIKIIAGGPSIIHDDPSFASKYPFIDYIVYGDGEKSFTMLLDSFYDPIDEKTIPNLITNKFKTNHEILRFKEYPSFSPYYDLKEDFINDYNIIKARSEQHNIKIILRVNYEFVRGCPYACTFCDWSSGLHHKVNVRRGDWKKELKFLSNYNIDVCTTDANFGMLKQDIEFIQFGLSLQNDNSEYKFKVGNYNKLNKSRVFEMFEQQYHHGKRSFKISLQHLDEQILKNINRPEISWEEHKELLVDFKQKHKDIQYRVELINGLPGSSVDLHIKQCIEFSTIPIGNITQYNWELLPNSPAYNKSYQEKFNLKTFKLNTLTSQFINSNIEDLYHDISKDNMLSTLNTYQTEFIHDNSLSYLEHLQVVYITMMYNLIFENGTKYDVTGLKFTEFIEYAMPNIQKISKLQGEFFEEKYNQYGFIIFGLPYGFEKEKTINFHGGAQLICKRLFKKQLIKAGMQK